MYTDRCNECFRKDTVLYECEYCGQVYCFEHLDPRPKNPIGHFCPPYEAKVAARKSQTPTYQPPKDYYKPSQDDYKVPKDDYKPEPYKPKDHYKPNYKNDNQKDTYQPPKDSYKPPKEQEPGELNDYIKSKRKYYLEKPEKLINFLIIVSIVLIIAILIYRIFFME